MTGAPAGGASEPARGRSGTASLALITGGGTAGHVLPALAVAEALVDRGHPLADLHYVGAQRGIETRLVPPTGLPHTFLDVVGVQRRLDRSNLGFGPKLRRAIRDHHRDRRSGPGHDPGDAAVGGYASLPAVLAARRLRIPVVVVSYDRRPGRASQLAAGSRRRRRWPSRLGAAPGQADRGAAAPCSCSSRPGPGPGR